MLKNYEKPILRLILLIVNSMFCAVVCAGELSLANPFGDHMVLQSNKPFPVWGKAKPKSKITLLFAGHTVDGVADNNGNWLLRLPALDIQSKPQILTVKTDTKTVHINDVLVGEVWLCSGQSNMDYKLGHLAKKNGKSKPLIREIANADFPLIRQLTEKKKLAPDKPATSVKCDWSVCTLETVKDFTATGFFFARELHCDLNVPVGIIKAAWGGTPIEVWTRREVLLKTKVGRAYVLSKESASKKFNAETAKAKVETWKKKNPDIKRTPSWVVRMGMDPRLTEHFPSTLYNGMIAPLIPFAIRGVIWYQGEDNARGYKAQNYRQAFVNMIQDWRQQWGQEELSFYFVQLPNYRKPVEVPGGSDWACLRESQMVTLKVPNTGMAVTIDIGEEKDIHPSNKIEVGRRLALWALAKDYGKDIVNSGPLYTQAIFKDGKAILTFREVGSGLMVGKKRSIWDVVKKSNDSLKWFQISGKDRKWFWADARITGNNTVEVRAAQVMKPVAVRYAWADNPMGCNLYNKEGLPASPFRTDNW